MASQKTKFTVGLFLASGITIGVISAIWLGMSRYLEKGQHYVTYFNESVQGLDIDSPVKYRGVPVGRVDQIAVAPDSRLIKVVLKIESVRSLDRDIVAQLKSVGLTGSMFVELDRPRRDEPDRSPALTFPSEYPIVASRPSDITQLFQGLDEVLNRIKGMDFEGIAEKVKRDLDRIDQAIVDADIQTLSRQAKASLRGLQRILDSERWERIMASVEDASGSLSALLERGNRTLSSAERIMGDVQGIVGDKGQTIREALDDFRKAMENANTLLEKASSLVSGTDETVLYMRKHLVPTSQNLEKASENLNQLLELLNSQPSQLLFGEPPAPRKVEPAPGKRD